MLSVSTQIAEGDDLKAFRRMLESVGFADELIIFNMERHDEEAHRIFNRYNARVVEVTTPKMVECIRAEQIQEASGDRVLIMDFDEVITPQLADEMTSVLKSPVYGSYSIKRRNYSLGMPLTHGGWGDDYVPRLFEKNKFLGWSKEIHSLPQVEGPIGRLTNYMEHHKDGSVSQMVAKTNRYSDIESAQFFAGNLPPVRSTTLLRKSFMEFFRRAILKGGLLDGRIGLIQSIYQAFSVFVTYAKLYEKQLNRKK